MGLNCGASCAKYVLFVFNIVFFLGGAAVLGFGIWIRVNSGSFVDVLKQVSPNAAAEIVDNNPLATNIQYVHIIAYVMIAIGGFVFLVAFFGCCGACKEWRPMLVAYAICLIIIMCVEIGIGIAAGVYQSELEGSVRNELLKMVANYDYQAWNKTGKTVNVLPDPGLIAANVPATMAWNAVHLLFGCCGIDDYRDFVTKTPPSPYAVRSPERGAPPIFCCKFNDITKLEIYNEDCFDVNVRMSRRDVSNANLGCVARVTTFVQTYAPAVIGVAVGIGLIELVGVFFAFCLCCAIGDKESRYR